MTPELKAKLDALRAKATADLTESEKSELALLVTIEKQATQIIEKDSLIGTKGTEIETLRAEISKASGADKKALEDQLALKEDALATMKVGLDALKEASKMTTDLAGKLSPEKPGHGDTVDPKEVEALQTKAYENEVVRKEFEELYKGLDAADKQAYKSDLSFKKLLLEQVLGSAGDETDDTPWGNMAKKQETVETAEERVARLFNKEGGNHRKLPFNSSGRGGRGGKGLSGMPKAKERPADTRTQ